MKNKVEKYIESYNFESISDSATVLLEFLNSISEFIQSNNICLDGNLIKELLNNNKIRFSLDKIFNFNLLQKQYVHPYVYMMLDSYVIKNTMDNNYTFSDTDINLSEFRTYDGLKIYLNDINRISLLSTNTEKELTNLYFKSHDNSVRNKIILANMRLVCSIAKRYQNRGLALEDLMQEGVFGLIKALEKFDPSRGYKFSTYATWWIKQSITYAIVTKSRNIRIPINKFNSLIKYLDLKAKLANNIKSIPSISEISNYLKISETKVIELENLMIDTISLEQPIDENGNELVLYIPSTDDTPEEKSLISCNSEDLLNAMKCSLNKVQKRVLLYRYGFLERVYTLEETRILLFKEGYTNVVLSRQGVAQIENTAMKRIKDYLEKREIVRVQYKSTEEDMKKRFLKRKQRICNIYSYYANFDISVSEVDRAIMCLDSKDLRILHSYYGMDLYNPVINELIEQKDFSVVEKIVTSTIQRNIVKNRELNDYENVDLGSNVLIKKNES